MILTKPKSVNAGPISGTGEGVAHSKRWYVALVRMHHEKKVAERLSKMGIDSFVPVQQQIHQWSDRRKMITSVLLPMMVFVHVDPKERMEVLSFSTVSRYMVMRGESSPAVIPDEQMARFRFMLDYSEEAVCMPSLAEALQKSNGRLLPLGWFYLLKALFMKRRAKMLDLLLVAVKPEYQNKGVNALLFSDLIPVYQKLGFIFAESNPELELNGKVQAQWDYFETQQHKRRRAFIKEIK